MLCPDDLSDSTGPEQPSSPDPGSVLCDKCKESVLNPSQSTEDIPLNKIIHQAFENYLSRPQMWPLGYLIGSSYSPLRVEQQLPKRDWRNAFEDLLALESGSDMISLESREQEKATAANLRWERANRHIEKINKLNLREAPAFRLAQFNLAEMKSSGNPAHRLAISWLEKKLEGAREAIRHRTQFAQQLKEQEEKDRDLSASRHKARGQWMASLISSGALTGWCSVLQDSEEGDTFLIDKLSSRNSSTIVFSEYELNQYFDEGEPLKLARPREPLYRVSRPAKAMPEDDSPLIHELMSEDGSIKVPSDEPKMWTTTPEHPRFDSQAMMSERITLPNGKKVVRVSMKTRLTNGEQQEKKVMIGDPGKVLQEVEKARAAIEDRATGFDELD